jgi:acyl carrier protein
MQHLSRISVILQKYMFDPRAVIGASTTLSDLEIDSLDIQMIFFDIEDAFDVQLSFSDGIDPALTVGGLIDLVVPEIAAKRAQSQRPAVRLPKRTWMSTGADR